MRVALTIWLVSFLGLSAKPLWLVVRGPGTGCWPPKCLYGQLPLATPVVSHGGRLFMIGDGAAPNHVYESNDGITWRPHTHDATWGARYKAADASYAGALWRVGGFVQSGSARTTMNDVWRSVDGRHWERIVEHAPWAARSDARLVVFRDSLLLVGGDPNDGKIWSTVDARVWQSRTTPSLPRSTPQGVLVYRNNLWILGHGQWDSARNDVWKSSDGVTWTQVTPNAPWPARTGAGFAVLHNLLWVVAGANHLDVWSSMNGEHWRAMTDMPGPPRAANYSVVFKDAFWVFGGKTGGLGGTGFWDGVAYLK